MIRHGYSPSSRGTIRIWFACFYCWFMLTAVLHGQTDRREIFVPVQDLKSILQAHSQHVFLTPDEYQRLAEQADKSEAEIAPYVLAWQSSQYEITVQGRLAAVSGEVVFDVGRPGVHVVTLPCQSIHIQTAEVNHQPTSLYLDDANQLQLILQGVGQHTFRFSAVSAVETAGVERQLALAVPTAATGQTKIKIAGDVELTVDNSVSPLAAASENSQPRNTTTSLVAQGQYDSESDTTEFTVLQRPGLQTYRWKLNGTDNNDRPLVLAESVVAAEITSTYERHYVACSIDVARGELATMAFRVPDGLEILNVANRDLNRWQLVGDDRSTLQIEFRRPVSGKVDIRMVAERTAVDLANWTFRGIEPIDTAESTLLLALLPEAEFQTLRLESPNWLPLNVAWLMDRVSIDSAQQDPNAPKLQALAAFYAPSFQQSLSAAFGRPEARVNVVSNILLTIGDERLQAEGGFLLTPVAETIFGCNLLVPAGWRTSAVSFGDGQPLPFEVFDELSGGRRLQIKLPQGIPPGQRYQIFFQADWQPDGWLEEWESKTLIFPEFRIAEASTDRGAVAIRTDADLKVETQTTESLRPLDSQRKQEFNLQDVQTDLAFEYLARPFQLQVEVQRQATRATAESASFLLLKQAVMEATYQLSYDIQNAKVKQLVFSLPASAPNEVSVTGRGDVSVRQVIPQPVTDGRRNYVVELQQPAKGLLQLQVQFEQPLTSTTNVADAEMSAPPDSSQTTETLEATSVAERLGEWTLPIIRAEDVEYQSGSIAVHSEADLLVQLRTDNRSIDYAEMTESAGSLPQNTRTLAAYTFLETADPISAMVYRPDVYSLPTALVQKAAAVISTSNGGHAVTAVRYEMTAKVRQIQLQLPSGSELWSVFVNGSPAKPQRSADRLLIPLDATTTAYNLQIVYRSDSVSFPFAGDLELEVPKLWLPNQDQAARQEIPIASWEWQVTFPDNYEVSSYDGTMSPRLTDASTKQLLQPTGNPLTQLWRILFVSPVRQRMAAALEAGTVMEYAPDDAITTDNAVTDFADEDSPEAAEGVEFEQREFADELDKQDVAGAEVRRQSNEPQSGFGRRAGSVESTSNTRDAARTWVMQGLRSLPMDVVTEGQVIQFRSLNQHPTLRLTLVDQVRSIWLAMGIGAAVFAVGAWAVRRRRFLIVVWLAALCLMASAITWTCGDAGPWRRIMEYSFLSAGFFLAVYWLSSSVWKLMTAVATWWTKPAGKTGQVSSQVITGFLLLLILTAALDPSIAFAQEADLGPVTVRIDEPLPPLTVPTDAVIIPYDANEPITDANQARQVLVPYAEYQRLWQLAHPLDEPEKNKFPHDFSFASANWKTTLEYSDSLTLQGTIVIQALHDGRTTVPLQLGNGVLGSATVNGKPSNMQFVVSQPEPNKQAVQSSPTQQTLLVDNRDLAPLAVLHLEQAGTYELQLTIHFPVTRQGGWRQATGTIPHLPLGNVVVEVPEASTEVRLEGLAGADSLETTDAQQQIESAWTDGGRFAFRWRPAVTQNAVDLTLTAESDAAIWILQKGVTARWKFQLEFSRTQRDSFRFIIPDGFVVQAVETDNLKSWRQTEETGGQLEVDLLQMVSNTQTITLDLQRWERMDASTTDLELPNVQVEGAMLHNGRLALLRSEWLDAQTVAANGMVRAEFPETISKNWGEPIPVKPYQAWRFVDANDLLRLRIERTTPKLSADVRSIFRIDQHRLGWESEVVLNTTSALFQLELELPANLRVTDIVCSTSCQWSVADSPNGRRAFIVLSEGFLGHASLVITGELTAPDDLTADISVPRMTVLNADKHSTTTVVQCDPSYAVQAVSLQNCETTLLDHASSWLNQSQRKLASLVLASDSPLFNATVRLAPKTATIHCRTISNFRVTLRTFEETILLDYDILDAGVRQIRFELPAGFEQAKIQAPLVRSQQTATLPNGRIQVTLALQDAVIGNYRVLVLRDRLLTDEAQDVAIPTVSDADILQQFVTLESAGRDEVVVEQAVSLNALSEQQQQWRTLAETLGEHLTQAYLVEPNQTGSAKLTVKTARRAQVETVGARIALAECTLVVDQHGAYRGRQIFFVDNFTEQFLDIQLPDGGQLWTAYVAQQPVKPARAANGQIRIPLVGSQGLDAYQVTIKYGGQMDAWRSLSAVAFPFVQTAGVAVEENQVRLYLPDEQHWFDFSNDMTLVANEQVLQEKQSNYKRERLSWIIRGVQSNSRVMLGKAKNELLAAKASRKSGQGVETEELKQLEQAVQQVEIEGANDNRDFLNNYFLDQSNTVSGNQLQALASNFAVDPTSSAKDRALNELDAERSFKRELAALNKDANSVEEGRRKGSRVQMGQRSKAFDKEGAAKFRYDQLEPSSRPSAGKPTSPAVVSGRVLSFENAFEEPQTQLESNTALMDSPVQETSESNLPIAATPVNSPFLAGAGMASLDFQVPTDGRVFRFRTSRGSASLTARHYSQQLLRRGQTAGVFAVVGFALLIAWRRGWIDSIGNQGHRAGVWFTLAMVSLPLAIVFPGLASLLFIVAICQGVSVLLGSQ